MVITVIASAVWIAVSIVTTGLLALLITRGKRHQQKDLRNPNIWHTEHSEVPQDLL